MSGNSDFDVMRNIRLPNWGRWGRQDDGRPDPEWGCGSIYNMGKKDETERDEEAAPEPPLPKIDHKDAELLDALIRDRLAEAHKHAIRGFFYKRQAWMLPKVPAAIRALLDLEYGVAA